MTVPVVLRRIVACIELNLSVAPQQRERIAPRSVQILSAPRLAAYFADNAPSEDDAVTDYASRSITGHSYNGTFYVPENLQGTVAGITDPTQKAPDKAPEQATCIHIEAVNQTGRKLDYFIYPGENDTDNFDIRRNRRYIVHATVMGENTIDTRVSTTDVVLGSVKPSYRPDEPLSTELRLLTVNNPDRRTASRTASTKARPQSCAFRDGPSRRTRRCRSTSPAASTACRFSIRRPRPARYASALA